ncbi:MAG: (Fe-S)-binding protein, partial [Akkermansiaceae bacterium]|nr:(Fe-S)-binding protein [Akkermansiaceae bacterium]
DHAREMAARNVEAFDGYDLVVVDAAGCSAHMKEYAHWGGPDLAPRVGDVTEVVAALIEEGTLPSLPAHGESVAIQDPCHL